MVLRLFLTFLLNKQYQFLYIFIYLSQVSVSYYLIFVAFLESPYKLSECHTAERSILN